MKRAVALLVAVLAAVVTTALPAAASAPGDVHEPLRILEPAAMRITIPSPGVMAVTAIVHPFDCGMPSAATITITDAPFGLLIAGRPPADCPSTASSYWRISATLATEQADTLIAWYGADYYDAGIGAKPSWWDACPRDGARCTAALNRPEEIDPDACRVVAAKQIDTYPSTKGLVALVRITVKGPCTRKVGPHRFWMAHELAATVPGDELRVFGDFDRAPTKRVIVFRYRLSSTPSLTWPGGTTLRLRDTR